MTKPLTRADRDFLDDLLSWDSSRRRIDRLLCQIALFAGGILIVAAAVFTAGRLEDRTVFTVLVPGFLSGLFLVGLYLLGEKRVRDRHRLAEIARKLGDA
jgi:hypothetical protein